MYVPVPSLTYFLSQVIIEINMIARDLPHNTYDSFGLFSTAIGYIQPWYCPFTHAMISSDTVMTTPKYVSTYLPKNPIIVYSVEFFT